MNTVPSTGFSATEYTSMFGGESGAGGEMFCQVPTTLESFVQSTGGDSDVVGWHASPASACLPPSPLFPPVVTLLAPPVALDMPALAPPVPPPGCPVPAAAVKSAQISALGTKRYLPMNADPRKARPQSRCPVDYTLQMVGGKWKPLILHRLSEGTLRFGQLQRMIPQVTQRVLTLQLRELERDGLITRTVFPEVPPRVEYALTPPARRLRPILSALASWLHENEGELGDADHGIGQALPAAVDSD